MSKISLNFSLFFGSFEADLGGFGMSKNEEKCLLGFNFQRLQHNIKFGSVLDWILGGFGLRFGRVLAPCWRQKLSERRVESKRIFKMRFEAEKCRFQAEKNDFVSPGGVARRPV